MGRRASNRKIWFDDFIRKSIAMFARLISNGWATQFPVIAEMLVLSDDRMIPRSVAPSGN
jgi:hypothetical protein